MRHLYKLAIFAALSAPLTFAQDSSGNNMLAGKSFRFRYVAPFNYNTAGSIVEVVAANGVITFQNGGTYYLAGNYIDNTQNGGKPQEFSTTEPPTGSYAISAAGIGYITNPLASLSDSFDVAEFGSVSFVGGDYIFTGSATESFSSTGENINDFFVAMLVGAPPVNSTFTSPYWLGLLDFASGGDVQVKNASVEIAPNGSGGLGTLNVTGYANNNQTGKVLAQSETGATYNFAADGGATLTLPLPSGVTAANAMFSGSRLMYVSSSGNFTLGWNPNGYDIIIGVKALTTPPTDSLFKGLYYTGNLSDEPLVVKNSAVVQGCGAESFFGAVNSDGEGDQIVHQRFNSLECGGPVDFGSDDYQLTTIGSDGTVSDTLGNFYALGASGNAFIAVSNSQGVYSLTFGIKAPSFCGASGLCLNPTGIFNAASYQPVTAAFAPGELITIYGTGFSSSILTNTGGLPFGTSLGTTQVLVNEQPAPIYYVSPTQISAILPYELSGSTTAYGEVQVNNGGLLSNQVQIYLTDANPGIFSQGQNGLGDAIAEHANGTIISPSNPAQPGETIVLALTGMGAVSPAVEDGAVGPTTPFSYATAYTTTNGLLVLFDDFNNNSTGQEATVSFAGLYPGLAGLYQMNVQIPTTVGPGEVYVNVITDAADNEQVSICVTACPAGASVSAATATARPALGPLSPKALEHMKAPLHTSKAKTYTPLPRPNLVFSRTPAPAVASSQN
jgi:uncharacterized protein (TIGR03437 family)